MSILIKGATLPDSCWDCEADFAYKIGCELWQDFEGFCEQRHPNCPLIEIPTPHGRLIDEDEIFKRPHCGECNDATLEAIEYAPTILEAEE